MARLNPLLGGPASNPSPPFSFFLLFHPLPGSGRRHFFCIAERRDPAPRQHYPRGAWWHHHPCLHWAATILPSVGRRGARKEGRGAGHWSRRLRSLQWASVPGPPAARPCLPRRPPVPGLPRAGARPCLPRWPPVPSPPPAAARPCPPPRPPVLGPPPSAPPLPAPDLLPDPLLSVSRYISSFPPLIFRLRYS